MEEDINDIIRSSLLNTIRQWGKDHASFLDQVLMVENYFRYRQVGGERDLGESLGRIIQFPTYTQDYLGEYRC